jgi:hypothetical protein
MPGMGGGAAAKAPGPLEIGCCEDGIGGGAPGPLADDGTGVAAACCPEPWLSGRAPGKGVRGL